MPARLQLDAMGPSGPYRALRRRTLLDVAGYPIAELSIVPPVFVDHTMAALRLAKPMPADLRMSALRQAGDIFAQGVVDGVPAQQYQSAVSRFAGVPATIVRESCALIEEAAASVSDVLSAAMPTRAVTDSRDPRTLDGCSAWTRRGEVLSVIAAGNHPGAHVFWLEALGMGYRVAVRPSTREPFTPHRLIGALHAAGFPHDHVVFLPTDHGPVDRITAGADLTIAYGGDQVVRKYAGDPRVAVFGPGRSKILLTREVDWRDHLDVIVESITRHAGLTCVNTTAVLVEGEPAPLAHAIVDRLAALKAHPPEHDDALLPVETLAAAERFEEYVRSNSAAARQVSESGIITPLGDGSAALGPAVFQLESASAARNVPELPFPCVWVAPWCERDGVAALQDSLVVTVLTRHDGLVDELLAEPTIANVYLGGRPTTWFATGIPHDGFLSDFLMRNKGFVRAPC